MSRTAGADRHLDLATALDYLDQRLNAARSRATEEHLGRPCPVCRERVRALGELLATLQGSRVEPIPAWLHERALAVFTPQAQASPAHALLESLAELVFDSRTQPLAAAARRSIGEARRVRYRCGAAVLDLEVERDGESTQTVRGSLAAPDAALWTLEVQAQGETRRTHPDAAGACLLEALPLGALACVLSGPAGTFRLPPLSP